MTLRAWFGPSQNEIWGQLSKEMRADFSPGGFWNGAKVQAEYGQWEITLDTFVVNTGKTMHSYTRMRAPYVNADGFQFCISRRNVFSDIGLWFGMQDIEVGQPGFDEDFIIQGNDEKKLQAFFAHGEIRALIDIQPQLLLSVRGDQGWFSRIYPEGVDELYLQVPGLVNEVERLKTLFFLFGETLDHLCRIGSAYENDPGVKL